MSGRVVLFSAGFATVCGLVPIAALVTPASAAAPGGDAFVVVHTFALPAADLQGSASVMCPAGTRALGGGASPTNPQPGTDESYRTFYSAPLDASGLASETVGGDVPRGWMVSVGHAQNVLADGYKLFVTCSASSDAVLASVQPSSGGLLTATAVCPGGMRAVGGGLGKIGDVSIPSNTQGPLMYQSGPVDGSGTVSGTVDGDVPIGWRTVTTQSGYGNRFFAVCSAQADAIVQTATYSVASDTEAGVATVTCPAGRRVLSGGDQVDGTEDDGDRLLRQGPFAPAELGAVSTGAVGRSWTAVSRGGSVGVRNHKVMAVCATDAVIPPKDTTPPDTTVTKGPGRKTFAKKAMFTFSSEAGAAFTCQLDKKPAKPCTSPFKVKKLKPGKHKLTVTATDAAGNADPSPAVFKWKVKRSQSRTRLPAAPASAAALRLASRRAQG